MSTFSIGKSALAAGAVVLAFSAQTGWARNHVPDPASQYVAGGFCKLDPSSTIGWAEGVPPGAERRDAVSVNRPLSNNTYRRSPSSEGEIEARSCAGFDNGVIYSVNRPVAAHPTDVRTAGTRTPAGWTPATRATVVPAAHGTVMTYDTASNTGYDPALANRRDAYAEELQLQHALGDWKPGLVRAPYAAPVANPVPAWRTTAYNDTQDPQAIVNRDGYGINTAPATPTRRGAAHRSGDTFQPVPGKQYVPITPNAPTPSNPGGRAY